MLRTLAKWPRNLDDNNARQGSENRLKHRFTARRGSMRNANVRLSADPRLVPKVNIYVRQVGLNLSPATAAVNYNGPKAKKPFVGQVPTRTERRNDLSAAPAIHPVKLKRQRNMLATRARRKTPWSLPSLHQSGVARTDRWEADATVTPVAAEPPVGYRLL